MDGTNKTKVLSLAIFSMLIFSLTFVAAQDTEQPQDTKQPIIWCSLEQCLGKFSDVLYYLFGLPKEESIGIFIVAVFIFLILMFGIIDILNLVGIFFSKKTNYLIGFTLAFLVTIFRGLSKFVLFLFNLVAGLGAIAVIAEIGAAFIIFIGLAWCSEKAFAWALKRKIKAEALRGAEGPAKAWEKLKKFEKLTEES
jgi:hypothetical protein